MYNSFIDDFIGRGVDVTGFEFMIDRKSFVDQSDLTRQAGDLIGNKVHHVNANALIKKSEES